MIITLTYEEVRTALAIALEEKTNHMYGEINPDDCWFTVKANDIGEVQDIEGITFTVEVE